MIWNLIVVAVSSFMLVVLLFRLRPLADLPTKFLFLAIWGRYFVSGLPDYSMIPIVGGLRGVAIYSICIALVGVVFVPFRYFFKSKLIPFYIFFLFIIVSGLLNNMYIGMIQDLTKWLFFLVIALLTYRAFEKYDMATVIQLFTIAAATPFILQLVGIVVGESFVGPDGATGYIGGYATDSSFSMILFTIMCIACLTRTRYDIWPLFLGFAALLGIFLTNYRTSVIAALPVFGVLSFSVFMRITTPTLRPLIMLAALVAVILGGSAFIQNTPERLMPAVEFVENLGNLFKSPEQYTYDERRILTGRVHTWAQYIAHFNASDPFHQFFGYGSEAYENTSLAFPHNEYISHMFEFGVIGLFCLVLVLFSQMVLMLAVPDRVLSLRLVACLIGFMLSCFAAMAIWSIEGLITLALLCGTTWAAYDGVLRNSDSAARPETARPRRPIGARWTTGTMQQRT